MTAISILPFARATSIPTDFGGLTWWANRNLGNSTTVTVGRCRLNPGAANPPHRHPNCSEILVVLTGRIAHTGADGREVEMGPGDTVSIPQGVPHRARNIGSETADLLVVFDSADRQVEGE